MSGNVRYTVQEGVARITLDASGEKVNVLNAGFLRDLDQVAEKLGQETGVTGAVILSAKEGGFIAGADINEIEKVTDPAQGAALAAEGQRILGRFSQLSFPVVAAIHGHCMGGGTEFVLACGYRVASEDASLALPEVKLGIFPGFGGTQRLPRLISIAKSLDIILSGRTVRAGEAGRIGLVDRVVKRQELEQAAVDLAREVARDAGKVLGARKRKRGGWQALLLEKNPLGRAVLFALARKNTLAKTGGHYPSPLKAIETIRRGLGLSLKEGLALEARGLGEMIVTPESKNLIHLFHLSQRPKKGAGVGAAPAEIKRAAVLGAGVMGGGIAQLLAAKGIPTVMKDIRQEAVDAGLDHARETFRRQLSRKGKGEEAVSEKMALITGTTDYQGFGEADLVIEAVVEKMAVKQQVLQETEPHLKPESFFATNTSALSVSELQKKGKRPEQVGGLHFFNPVDKMPLVEVIRGEKSSDAAVATLFALAARLGKTPIVAADRPGFLVNRLLGTYLNEACLLAEEGVDWLSLDRLMKSFGLPMGPFRLIDEVGIDIGAEVGTTLCGAFPYLPESAVMRKAVESGLKGKKGGLGFYRYEKGHSKGPNLSAEGQLGLRKDRPATSEDLNRLLYLMVNEAGRCLEEKVVAAPEDVDTGMVFGTGFPPFRGGLCKWADSEGLPAIRRTLEGLAKSHGERFAPCGDLKGRERFYP